jgi:hypothetical protein
MRHKYINKRIDLGEYIVLIKYDITDGSLNINVLDELEESIEELNITNDNGDEDIDISLN